LISRPAAQLERIVVEKEALAARLACEAQRARGAAEAAEAAEAEAEAQLRETGPALDAAAAARATAERGRDAALGEADALRAALAAAEARIEAGEAAAAEAAAALAAGREQERLQARVDELQVGIIGSLLSVSPLPTSVSRSYLPLLSYQGVRAVGGGRWGLCCWGGMEGPSRCCLAHP
jgi:hypothetical protein